MAMTYSKLSPLPTAASLSSCSTLTPASATRIDPPSLEPPSSSSRSRRLPKAPVFIKRRPPEPNTITSFVTETTDPDAADNSHAVAAAVAAHAVVSAPPAPIRMEQPDILVEPRVYEFDDDFPSIAASESTAPPADLIPSLLRVRRRRKDTVVPTLPVSPSSPPSCHPQQKSNHQHQQNAPPQNAHTPASRLSKAATAAAAAFSASAHHAPDRLNTSPSLRDRDKHVDRDRHRDREHDFDYDCDYARDHDMRERARSRSRSRSLSRSRMSRARSRARSRSRSRSRRHAAGAAAPTTVPDDELLSQSNVGVILRDDRPEAGVLGGDDDDSVMLRRRRFRDIDDDFARQVAGALQKRRGLRGSGGGGGASESDGHSECGYGQARGLMSGCGIGVSRGNGQRRGVEDMDTADAAACGGEPGIHYTRSRKSSFGTSGERVSLATSLRRRVSLHYRARDSGGASGTRRSYGNQRTAHLEDSILHDWRESRMKEAAAAAAAAGAGAGAGDRSWTTSTRGTDNGPGSGRRTGFLHGLFVKGEWRDDDAAGVAPSAVQVDERRGEEVALMSTLAYDDFMYGQSNQRTSAASRVFSRLRRS